MVCLPRGVCVLFLAGLEVVREMGYPPLPGTGPLTCAGAAPLASPEAFGRLLLLVVPVAVVPLFPSGGGVR